MDVSLFDNLLYNCVGVYSIPRLEKIYNSSNDGEFSILMFEIIFFFIVSIVSSPYSLSNENSTFILYVSIFSNSVLLNISLKYTYSSSPSFSWLSLSTLPLDFIFFPIYESNLSFNSSADISQFCFVTGFVLP